MYIMLDPVSHETDYINVCEKAAEESAFWI